MPAPIIPLGLKALLKYGALGGLTASSFAHGPENTARSIFDPFLGAFGVQDEGDFRDWQAQNPYSEPPYRLAVH